MDISKDLEKLEALAVYISTSPRRVIIENWKLMESALGRAFPHLVRTADPYWLDGALLLAALEQGKALDEGTLGRLKTIYREKEKMVKLGQVSNLERMALDEQTERDLPPRAAACIGESRWILTVLFRYKIQRKYRRMKAVPQESGPRGSGGFSENTLWIVLGLLVAGGLWVGSYLAFPGSRRTDKPMSHATSSAPVAAIARRVSESAQRTMRSTNLLGDWQRADGLTMRITAHPDRVNRFVGFIVKVPAYRPASGLAVKESVLVVEWLTENTFIGLQRWSGGDSAWSPMALVVQNEQIETAGGLFKRIAHP